MAQSYKSPEHYAHSAARFAQDWLFANHKPAIAWSDLLIEVTAYIPDAIATGCNPIYVPRKAAQLWAKEYPDGI